MADFFGAIRPPSAGSRTMQGDAVRWFTARRNSPRRRTERIDLPSVRIAHVRWAWPSATAPYKGLAHLAAVFLSIALAYKLAELTWLMVAYVHPEEAAQALLVSREPAPYAQTSSNSAARDLPSFHLFGQVPSNETIAAIEPAVTPTRLPLTLRGTLASADTRFARALIANDRGEERSFAANELTFGETTLETIHPDHVVIRHGARRELLRFPHDTTDNAAGGASVVSAPSEHVEPESEFGPSVLTPLREPRDANTLRDFRKYLADHPHAFAALTEKPAETDPSGRVIGYRLDHVNTAAYLRQLGLRPGDVLTAINDVQLSDSRSLSPLIHTVASMEEIQIHYTRRGQPRVIALGAF